MMFLCRGWRKALFLLFFCFFMCATMARAEVVERILAVVNDDVITKSEVDQMAKAMKSQPGAQMLSGKELEKKLLDAMITQKLAIAEASPDGYKELASAQILSGKCWTVPVLANGKIYARNAAGHLVCVDVSR